jgi:hypothetical protein
MPIVVLLSLPLRALRGAYWFFVRRQIMRHQTIEDQMRRGWV